jgi:hypothetical protein
MAKLNVNSIVDRNDNGPSSLDFGATIPSGQTLTNNGNFNITGVSTVGFLTASNVNVSGVVTASSFVGDGSGLVGLQVVSASKSIALKVILDPLPFRS